MSGNGVINFGQLIRITEILERSVQGRTKPFLCRGEDGHLYYVKGRYAGRRSLICEWLAGHLGRLFGLPIPPFTLAVVPEQLIRLHPEGIDLGTEPVFASQLISPHLAELGFAHIPEVPQEVRKDVLVFDFWVRNEDRSLTAHGGNPNLLWDPANRELVAIDHNLAFDGDFEPQRFLDTHVFSRDFSWIVNDLAERAVYAQRLTEVLSAWRSLCDSVPKEWWFHDEERTIPTDFDTEITLANLLRCREESFWRLET